MPGRGKVGGHGRGKGHGGGDPGGVRETDRDRADGPGRSEWAPGHLKKDAGAASARDFAPGHGGEAPGRRGDDGRPSGGRGAQDEADPLT